MSYDVGHYGTKSADGLRWYDLAEIELANTAAGFHWFEPATLRAFRSRILASVYHGGGGVFFVSSEQLDSWTGVEAPRRYTVRQFHPETGNISKVGEFNALTRARAITAAKRAAAGTTGPVVAGPRGGEWIAKGAL
jgi:hypothetical protein